MSALFDRVIRSANQNFHDVIESKSKALLCLHSMHAREKFLRRDRTVERLAWFQAIIAAIARNFSSSGGSRIGCIIISRRRRYACLYRNGRPAFAEIPQQCRPPAMACFRIRDHGAQLLVRDALLAFTLFLDETPLFHDIAHTEEQHALARQTIATGASRFLVVPFDVLRQIMMNNEADVRFVNTHAERDRRG